MCTHGYFTTCSKTAIFNLSPPPPVRFPLLLDLSMQHRLLVGGALSRCRFDPTHGLSPDASRILSLFLAPSLSSSVFVALSLSPSISLCPLPFHSRTCNVSYRSPIFTSDAHLLHDAALQVENTDRLGINRSRDTEPSRGERRRKTRARVTRAERNQEGDEVSRKREREEIKT